MKRDLTAMMEKTYDVIIVGGGITGACVARDAALRGLSVAVLEKNDFAGATTAASSKLIHGGLRYLMNLELGLVRDSLRERRIWSNIAPHQVYPLTFLMPITSLRLKDRAVRAIGLTLYDWLAYDRNRLDDPEMAIPKHKKMSRKEALDLEPGLESDDLQGAMEFTDYQMYCPERLALGCLMSAVEAGAEVANYAEVIGFLQEGGGVTGVLARDNAPACRLAEGPRGAVPRTEYTLRGRLVVNAAGPWADILMASLTPGKHAKTLIRSKGIHLLTRPLTQKYAVAVLSEHGHFFILPWRGYSILGTTDTVYKGDPDAFRVTEKDITDFLDVINQGYPAARLTRADVLHAYGGLRPIVDTSSSQLTGEDEDAPDSYKASRAAEIYDHEEEDGIKGVITAIGGKWTTSRHLAEHLVDLICEKLELGVRPCTTATTPIWGGATGPFAEFVEQAVASHDTLQRPLVESLARDFGNRMDNVLALAQEDNRLLEPLSARFPDIAAQVTYAVREEMALTVEDVIFRRSGLGTLGSPGDEALVRIADLMGGELGWDTVERTRQTDRAKARFRPSTRTRAVVNPHSGGDRTGARWPMIAERLNAALGPVDVVFTDGPMAAKHLTAQALKEGIEQIIAVGGDGTVNEVVNGFFENGRPINPNAVLAVLASGTGGDFRKTFGIPIDIDAQIARIAESPIRAIDIGKLTFREDATGREGVRYFDNIASFGLSGATDRAVNQLRFARKFGGKIAFQWGAFKALLSYRNQPIRLCVDDTFDEVINTATIAICNGQFFGGGMHIAPEAAPDDGLFDIIILRDAGRLEILMKLRLVYSGRHLTDRRITFLRGRKIVATPVSSAQAVLLDVDGEAPGQLPATFEIIPRAMLLRS
ncbi:MAG TPA: FAD-dependent oxidoreductase [Candidatus Hydrogenedentes bacterium]|mgnify:CR=1 FL=1|nr:FAD-dependent oxidoreductase [Candidatus Hydrogenedentota bacterium]